MDGDTYQNPRRKLIFNDNHTHDYLQLTLYNLNQLIKQSEQELIDEQQLITTEENKKLNKIQNLQNDINHIQTNIDSLNHEIDHLTSNTYEMLIKQNDNIYNHHNHLLKDSIEYLNHLLQLTNQQEKLFLIRNQLDIDQNKLTTNISLVKECQQQLNQYEQMKLKKQIELQNLQQIQSDYVEKQLKLQKLQISIEQQTRIRNDIQQMKRSCQPKKYHQELDLTNDRLSDIDEEQIFTNYSLNKSKDDKNNL